MFGLFVAGFSCKFGPETEFALSVLSDSASKPKGNNQSFCPRSFSKMNCDFSMLKTAMEDDTDTSLGYEQWNRNNCEILINIVNHDSMITKLQTRTKTVDTEECSSTATFKGVISILRTAQPHALILENVDSIDAATSRGDDQDSV